MKQLILTLFLLIMVSAPAEANVFTALGKVIIRLPGSTVKASIDTVRMAGISLSARLNGYRDPN